MDMLRQILLTNEGKLHFSLVFAAVVFFIAYTGVTDDELYVLAKDWGLGSA